MRSLLQRDEDTVVSLDASGCCEYRHVAGSETCRKREVQLKQPGFDDPDEGWRHSGAADDNLYRVCGQRLSEHARGQNLPGSNGRICRAEADAEEFQDISRLCGYSRESE